ncbi:MAG: UDP-N-acetylglucosamine 2-epimerase [Pontimonas sp.]
MKHIAVFTSSRSDWGILEILVSKLWASEGIKTTVLASGSHFDSRFGNTIDAILAQYPSVTVRLNAGPVGQSPHEAAVMASRVSELVSAWCEENIVDAVVILGDRFEALACASAVVLHGIPIVHLHGGEITTGAIDDSIRHALTKLARLHFPVHEDYRRRLIQLGENPDSIVVAGSLAVEGVKEQTLLSKSELESSLEMDIPDSFLVCAVHPVTTSDSEVGLVLDALEHAFRNHPDVRIILTAPAPDPGFEEIERRFGQWCKDHPRSFLYRASLGSNKFLSLVALSLGLVGNSSSGLLEIPGLGVPTLNIGTRQEGRVRANSVIDAAPTVSEVGLALCRILSPEFQETARQTVNPLAGKHPTRAIIGRIEATDFTALGPKLFRDVEMSI